MISNQFFLILILFVYFDIVLFHKSFTRKLYGNISWSRVLCMVTERNISLRYFSSTQNISIQFWFISYIQERNIILFFLYLLLSCYWVYLFLYTVLLRCYILYHDELLIGKYYFINPLFVNYIELFLELESSKYISMYFVR